MGDNGQREEPANRDISSCGDDQFSKSLSRKISKIMGTCLGFGVFIWIADAVLDYLFFYKGQLSLAEVLITSPPAHEMYVRFLILGCFLGFGVYSSFLAAKRMRNYRALTSANQQSRAAYDKLDTLVEFNADGIMLIDHDGFILFTNSSAAAMFDWRKEDLEGQHFGHPLTPGRSTEIELISGNNEPVVVELRTTATEWEGTSVFLTSLRDITERKQAEQQLEQLQEFTQSTIDSLTAHLAVIDEDANIITVNAAWRRFADDNGMQWSNYGIGANYLQIADQASRYSSEGASETGTGIRQLLTEQADVFEEEYPCHSPSEQRWFRLRGTRFKSRYGARVVLAHENITQRKQAELDLQKALDDLRSAQQQLVEQERQQALTTMASGIAHDFNNALSPIQGFADLLLEDTEAQKDPEKLVRYLEHIRKSANTASETVRRMRKFYRPREETSFAPVDLNKVIEEAVSVTEPRWKQEAQASGRNIEIRTEPDATCHISGNEAELHEMLTNLIFNAVDAMPEGGVITIKTHTQDKHGVLEVSDTGVGMSQETKTKCLDPFYTTKGADGSGLGLATLQGTVDRHRGSVDIQSEEGNGTTFRISLPLSHGEASSGEQKSIGQARALNILTVEDEAGQREFLSELLGAEGHSVDVASDGIEGLRKFNANWYDLVITDRAMPEMSGDHLAREIKQSAPHKPVIMLTGFGDMMDAANENPENVDRVLSKPVTREKLQEAMNSVIREP